MKFHQFFLSAACALFALPAIPVRAAISAVPYQLAVSDWSNDQLGRIDSATLTYTSLTAAGAGGLDNPSGLSVARDGSLLVANSWTNDIRRFNATTGTYLGVFASDAQLPILMHARSNGDLYVASRDGRGVFIYDGISGAKKGAIQPDNNSVLWWAWDVDFLPGGDVLVSSFERGSIVRFDGSTGALKGTFSPQTSDYAAGMAWGPDGNLYVARYGSNRIERLDGNTGASLGTFASGNGMNRPLDLTFAPDGRLFVANERTNIISIFDGGTGLAVGQVVGPSGANTGYSSIIVLPEPFGGTMLVACISAAACRWPTRRRH